MMIKLDERKKFTGSTTPLAKMFGDTNADARLFAVTNLLVTCNLEELGERKPPPRKAI